MKVALPDLYDLHAKRFREETNAVRHALQLEAFAIEPGEKQNVYLAKCAALRDVEHAIAKAIGATFPTSETK